MWMVEQHPFDLPDVGVGEPPVVVAHLCRDVDDGVAGHASGEIDVGIGIAAARALSASRTPVSVRAAPGRAIARPIPIVPGAGTRR